MYKWILSLSSILIIGCGGSSSGGAELNSFNMEVFDPYTEPEFKYAWHLQRVSADYASSRGITSDSHINIFSVWNKKIFGSKVKVAIIDYDFNPDQEDIAPNVIRTYNVDTDSVKVRKNSSEHGTGVASIIAGSHNKVGTLGVAPKSQLILIDADLSDDASKIKAFYKAKEFGAKVISCSWSTPNVSESVSKTIKELYNDNITIVFGSGNRNYDLDDWHNSEAELEWVIGVGASTEDNKKAHYSNYGDNIDILAPGGRGDGGLVAAKYSTTYTKRFNGTSASAPIVAGVVALMLEVNPYLTPKQVRKILINTTEKIDSENANYNSNGFSHTHAYGKVNATRAVSLAKTY